MQPLMIVTRSEISQGSYLIDQSNPIALNDHQASGYDEVQSEKTAGMRSNQVLAMARNERLKSPFSGKNIINIEDQPSRFSESKSFSSRMTSTVYIQPFDKTSPLLKNSSKRLTRMLATNPQVELIKDLLTSPVLFDAPPMQKCEFTSLILTAQNSSEQLVTFRQTQNEESDIVPDDFFRMALS